MDQVAPESEMSWTVATTVQAVQKTVRAPGGRQDGTLAWSALDRAESIDSSYRLAELLRRMVSMGIRLPAPASGGGRLSVL